MVVVVVTVVVMGVIKLLALINPNPMPSTSKCINSFNPLHSPENGPITTHLT